jgi:hypothetical protein
MNQFDRLGAFGSGSSAKGRFARLMIGPEAEVGISDNSGGADESCKEFADGKRAGRKFGVCSSGLHPRNGADALGDPEPFGRLGTEEAEGPCHGRSPRRRLHSVKSQELTPFRMKALLSKIIRFLDGCVDGESFWGPHFDVLGFRLGS